MHDRWAAAVRENKIILGNELPKWVDWILLHPLEGCRGIDVPKDNVLVWTFFFENCGFEQLVEHPDSARFYDHVAIFGGLQLLQSRLGFVFVNDNLGPIRWTKVAMLLPLVRIRLIKSDAMSALVQRSHDSAIIRGRPIPIGGKQTGSEKRDLHTPAPSNIRRLTVVDF